MDWYFDKGGSESGPHSTAEINRHIKEGLIIAETYVWRKGMSEWLAASDVPDFADWFVRPPPIGEGLREAPPPRRKQENKQSVPASRANVASASVRPNDSPTKKGSKNPHPPHAQGGMRAQRRAKEREKSRKGATWLLGAGLAGIVGVVGIAVALLTIDVDWPFQGQLSQPGEQTEPPSVDEALATALLTGRYGDSLRVIMQNKPAEFADVVNQLDESQGNNRSTDGMTALAAEVTDFFLNRYRPYAPHASDDVLKAVIETRLSNIEAVLKIYPDQCAAFIVGGPASLGVERAEVLAPLLYAETTALLSVYFDGTEAEETRPEPSDNDLELLLDDWQASGVTREDITSLELSDPSDPNLCPARASFLRFVLVADGEGAERVRGSFVSQIATN